MRAHLRIIAAIFAGIASTAAPWLVVAVAATATMSTATAADITALFPGSMEHTAHEVVPPFEKSSGHKMTIQYGTAGGVARSAAGADRGGAGSIGPAADRAGDDLRQRGILYRILVHDHIGALGQPRRLGNEPRP